MTLYVLTPRPCPHERRGSPHASHADLVECVLSNGSPGFRIRRTPPLSPAEVQRRWRVRRRARLLDRLGGYCGANAPPGVGCGANGRTPLEFAHKAPTSVAGRSRGFDRRMKDVADHPESYCLLCPPCHLAFDAAG